MFFPRNSFVTNTTLTRTNNPRSRGGLSGNGHIVCEGGSDPTLLVTWHNINGQLMGCPVHCGDCGYLCQNNGGVGVDPQDQTHTDIHMYTDSAAYVNQDLECQMSDSLNSPPSQSAFIGVYLINGGECCVSYVIIYCTRS